MNHRTFLRPSATPAAEPVAVLPAPPRARPRENTTTSVMPEFTIGPFTVRRVDKQHYRLYSIYAGRDGVLIGRQASYPSIFDCLEKLEKAFGSGKVANDTYYSILQSRDVAQEIRARSASQA